MGDKNKKTFSGQEAWQYAGIEMSPKDAEELKGLKARLKNGEVLTYKEQRRFADLKEKQKTVTHIIE